jgi:hypothetical protein
MKEVDESFPFESRLPAHHLEIRVEDLCGIPLAAFLIDPRQ